MRGYMQAMRTDEYDEIRRKKDQRISKNGQDFVGKKTL
jgi:hypothetical protein